MSDRNGGRGRVEDDAVVSERARVEQGARVCGRAHIHGEAVISGNAVVEGEADVYGQARVFGDARVSGDALVCGSAQIRAGHVGDGALVYAPHHVQFSIDPSGTQWTVYLTSDGFAVMRDGRPCRRPWPPVVEWLGEVVRSEG